MAETKVCDVCSDMIEAPPFTDTYNTEDFHLLVSECQSRRSNPEVEDADASSDADVIKWMLENTSKIWIYFWDIPDMVSECVKGEVNYMLAALKEYGVYVKFIDFNDHIYSYSYNCNKNNAIINAAKFGTPNIITWLVDHGSSAQCVDDNHTDCLELAAGKGKLKNMIRLVNCGANINGYNSQTILQDAASKGYHHIIKWIFKRRTDACECISALHKAIETKNYDIVEWLVDNNVSVIKGDFCKNTSVHFAAKAGNIVCMKWLLQKGAKMFVKNQERETVVHIAAMNGHIELFKWLHMQGGNIQERKIFGYTPLHLASLRGHLDCVRYLVHNECEVNSKDREGKSVLHVAVSSKNLKLVVFLVEHKADIHALDDNRDSVLQYGLKPDTLIYNFDNMIVTSKFQRLLQEYTILKMLKWLVSIGCDPKIRNVNSETILNKACNSSLFAIAKWLLEIGLDVNDAVIAAGRWFGTCKERNDWDFLHYCLDYIKNLNAIVGKETLLHLAVPYIEAVKILIKYKVDINVLDENLTTPLNLALQNASFEVAHYLIDYGANINLADKLGYTPLHHAANHTDFNIINKLILSGADVNAKNTSIQCPLRIAIPSGRINIINLLINAGADINSLDENNDSLVKAAANSGNWVIVKLLIEKGADLTIGNNHTLISNATYTEDIELVMWLLNHGATITNDQSVLFGCSFMKGDKKLKIIKLLLQHGADINSLNDNGNTILFDMIDDLQDVDFLIKNGINVNIQDSKEKSSVLHRLIPMNYYYNIYSSEYEISVKYRILQKLLHAGANVNLKDNEGNTVLHHSVTSDSFVELAKLLVLSGADINARNNVGDSVMHLVISGEIALFLCEHGAQINCKNISGTSVLQKATKLAINIKIEHLNIVKLLQKRKTDPDNTISEEIIASITACRYFRYVDFLVKNVKDINEVDHKGRNALHYAVIFNMLSIFKKLLQNGANVYAAMVNGNTVLHLAAMANRVKIAKYILKNFKCESHLAVNERLETPLHLALICNSTEIAELLVKDVDVNCKDAASGQTALHIACINGNLNMVKMLISHGANIYCKNNENLSPVQITAINCRSNILEYIATNIDSNILLFKSDTKQTLLHLAVKSGKYNNVPNKIVEYLLAQNVYPIDTIDNMGNSALHYACLTFMVDIITMLVEHGANTNLRNKKNDTPFHNAARTGSIDVINYLLEKGANPNLKNKRGNTINHISIAHARINPSKCLLQRGADIMTRNQKGNCIILQTAVSGGTHLFKYLLENFSNSNVDVINNRKQTALSLAIKFQCNSHNIETLIEKQNDINIQDICGNTVLHDALRYKSTRYVEMIILRGANVNMKNKQGDTAVHIACKYIDHIAIITLLIDYLDDVACVNKLGWNILHCASSGNSIAIVEMLLSLLGVNHRTDSGDTILHIACKNKNMGVFRWLIQNCSALINVSNHEGESVLLTCLKLKHIDVPVLDLLLEHGANVQATNANGDTALHIAASFARMDFVTYFLHQGLDVNIRNTSQETSLLLAAHHGYLDVVRMLVQAMCDVNAINVQHQSALHLAAKAGNISVVKYLVQDAQCDSRLVDDDAKNAAQLAEQFQQLHIVQWFKHNQA